MSNARIYIASRTYRAAKWRRLRDIEGWQITSSWIDEAGTGESTNLGNLWSRVEAEIAGSKLLILYVEMEDFPLKGALIEVGMAIATPIPICIVAPGIILDPALVLNRSAPLNRSSAPLNHLRGEEIPAWPISP